MDTGLHGLPAASGALTARAGERLAALAVAFPAARLPGKRNPST
ncbi:hypothetical protein [Nonomuraea typhae]|nr:hypothetical protein [Nonomuraea typhae]